MADHWFRETYLRNQQVCEARERGLTFGQLARRFGISRNAVAGICWRGGCCVSTSIPADRESVPG